MFMMNSDMPRTISSSVTAGLYIELKDYAFYNTGYGLNMAEMLYDKLKEYNLETVEKSI